MVLASINVHMVKGAFKNGCHQYLCLQGELQLPPASMGGSPRPAVRSDPGPYQITPPALGPGVCEILYASSRSGVSISHSPQGLLKVSPTGLQSLVIWGLVFLVQDFQSGELIMGLRTLTSLGEPLRCNYSPVCGLPTWGYGT